MNENIIPVRDHENDYIDDETGEYVNSKTTDELRYRFYLRFIKRHWDPCDECQEKLHKKVQNAELYLGNKSYEPAIELSRQWMTNDDLWKVTERRTATKEDYKNLYGSDWEKYWNSWLEYQKELGK